MTTGALSVGGIEPVNLAEAFGKFDETWSPKIVGEVNNAALNSPLKKALLTGFHSTAKHNATKAVSPSSETMRTI